MDFLDSILGKTKLPESKTENLFAISTAEVTLETKLGLKPDGAAAVCIKPVESSRYETARLEIEGLLNISYKVTKTDYSVQKDSYGYLWLVLRDPDLDDLVATMQMVSSTLIDEGFGTQLLAAIYRFKGNTAVYWIYSFKEGAYYPFVPSRPSQRDNAFELRLKSVMEPELPIVKDLTRWYPIWGMPI